MNHCHRMDLRNVCRRAVVVLVFAAVALAFARPASAAGPIIYLSDLNFGTLQRGLDGATTIPLQICNVGDGELRFSNPADSDATKLLEWDRRSGFSVPAAEIAGLKNAVLTKNQCYTLHVTFTPTSVGLFQATARFHANVRVLRDTSQWTAIVIHPLPQLNGYDWGSQWIVAKPGVNCSKNEAPAYEAYVSIVNRGVTDVYIKSVELLGQDALDGAFSLDNSDRTTSIQHGDDVRPGDTLRQKVLFVPTEERAHRATVRVITDIMNDTLLATLSGNGVESHASITGIVYDTSEFKYPYPYEFAAVGWVLVKALPTRPLTITDIRIQGPNAEDFWLDPLNQISLPRTLQPGETDSFRVEYRVTTWGERTATVVVSGDQSYCDDSTGVLRAYTYRLSDVTAGDASPARGLEVEAIAGPGGATSVRCRLAAAMDVRVEIFDGLGRGVAVLADGRVEAGEATYIWNSAGEPGGVYYCRVTSGGSARTVRLVIAH